MLRHKYRDIAEREYHKGFDAGQNVGYTQGFAEGYSEGYRKGYEEGFKAWSESEAYAEIIKSGHKLDLNSVQNNL